MSRKISWSYYAFRNLFYLPFQLDSDQRVICGFPGSPKPCCADNTEKFSSSSRKSMTWKTPEDIYNYTGPDHWWDPASSFHGVALPNFNTCTYQGLLFCRTSKFDRIIKGHMRVSRLTEGTALCPCCADKYWKIQLIRGHNSTKNF